MKIMCQEHYDKVVQYAESIGDKTFQECLEKLRQWEKHPSHPCEIELYRDFAPYSFLFKQRYPDGRVGVVGGLVYHGRPDRSHCFNICVVRADIPCIFRPEPPVRLLVSHPKHFYPRAVSRLDDPHLKNHTTEYVNSHFFFTDKVDIGSVRYVGTDTFRGGYRNCISRKKSVYL